MNINHIGYAVKNISKAKESFAKLGFTFDKEIDDFNRNIIICFGRNSGYVIELVQPLDKNIPSPVDSYLTKCGPTPYHICYNATDLIKEVDTLKKQGFRVIINPSEAVAFDDQDVVFLYNASIGMIELVELNSK